MTNQLNTIKAAVAAHFAAKEARTQTFINDPNSFEAYVTNFDYNPSQDAAMLMLRDLLPLLDTIIEWIDIPVAGSWSVLNNASNKLDEEVAKLLKEEAQ